MSNLLMPFHESEDDYILHKIQEELNKLLKRGLPDWPSRQNDALDNITHGIVSKTKDPVDTLEKLDDYVQVILKRHPEKTHQEVYAYCANRWFDTQSERAYVVLCCKHERVTKEPNKKNRDADIWIDSTIPMDVKVTRWPKTVKPGELQLRANINKASSYRIIEWYYKNQAWVRFNWQNRLFIVCYDALGGKHAELKADFTMMDKIIEEHFDKFDAGQLHKVSQQEVNGRVISEARGHPVQEVALSDIILNYKERPFITDTRPLIDPITGLEQLNLFKLAA